MSTRQKKKSKYLNVLAGALVKVEEFENVQYSFDVNNYLKI